MADPRSNVELFLSPRLTEACICMLHEKQVARHRPCRFYFFGISLSAPSGCLRTGQYVRTAGYPTSSTGQRTLVLPVGVRCRRFSQPGWRGHDTLESQSTQRHIVVIVALHSLLVAGHIANVLRWAYRTRYARRTRPPCADHGRRPLSSNPDSFEAVLT